MKRLIGKAAIVAVAVLFGATSFWATNRGQSIGFGEKNALAVVDLPAGERSASASFTTTGLIEQFHVGALTRARRDRLRLSITGPDMVFVRVAITRTMRFQCGRDIPPGDYTVVLEQEVGNRGGRVVIGESPVGITGWQIWSRSLLGLVILSGLWAWRTRKSRNPKHRMTSAYFFHMFFLAFVLIFLYLLVHEGGHALGAMFTGRFDYSRSDFWGIHGNPHSGIKPGTSVGPWQRAIESFSGPALPTLIGWALFVFWTLPFVKRACETHHLLNLYLSAIIAMSVFPFIAIAGYLLGVISDGDWRGFIENVPGPLWLVHTLLWAALLANAFILWRVVPELRRSFRALTSGLNQAGG